VKEGKGVIRMVILALAFGFQAALILGGVLVETGVWCQ
jgi:hypothetical protein